MEQYLRDPATEFGFPTGIWRCSQQHGLADIASLHDGSLKRYSLSPEFAAAEYDRIVRREFWRPTTRADWDAALASKP